MTDKHPFSTRRGRRLRQAKLDRDPLCEPCRSAGRITEAETVHHAIPLEQGGPAFPPLDGLVSMCLDHHKQSHGSKPKVHVDANTGFPLGQHWWNE